MDQASEQASGTSDPLTFAEVFKQEAEVINFRRRVVARGRLAEMRLKAATEPSASDRPRDQHRQHLLVARKDISADTPAADQTKAATNQSLDEMAITGLALSGGGQRSATFCLGVLQGLDSLSNHDEPHVLDAIDYLSVVSGGGYIGTSLAAGLRQDDYSFPFDSRVDDQETPETQHLRNFSNFLAPSGVRDYAISVAYIVRGILVNIVLVAPILLVLAALTKLCNSNPCDLLHPEILGKRIDHLWYLPRLGAFTLSFNVLILVAVTLVATSLVTSFTYTVGSLRSREIMGYALFALLGFLVLTAAFDAQVYVLRKLFGGISYLQAACANDKFAPPVAMQQPDGVSVPDQSSMFNWLSRFSAGLAALATALVALGQRLLNIARSTAGEASWAGYFKKYASKLTLYLAALVVPALLWCMYLALSFWAIDTVDASVTPFVPTRLVHTVSNLSVRPGVVGYVFQQLDLVGTLYLIAAALLGIVCFAIGPNANSLHALYRDRLSRAYLFSRAHLRSKDIAGGTERRTFSWLKPQGKNKEWLDESACAPLLLVNTALNVEGSSELKKRGRKADTFTFSPLHIGSTSTKYVAVEGMETKPVGGVTLATAMATSGAAASANMGRNTVGFLTFSLSMLNVRLGYWLANPKRLRDLKVNRLARWRANIGFLSFTEELLGLLNDKHRNVYLTDGGHIENLGIYELLRRRCKVILAVDAEADQELTFPSFTTLQIMARIDLGVRIDLPWQPIQKGGTKVTSAAPYGAAGFPGSAGPHAAIGLIRYNDTETGILIYIKAAMSGDEKDYIIDYKRRNSTFPHETTLDQFFSEEQFEVYRALGFHSVRSLFAESDTFGVPLKKPSNWHAEIQHALALLNIPPDMAKKVVARS